MNIFVLYRRMAPYMAACLRAAASGYNLNLAGISYEPDPHAPLSPAAMLEDLGPWDRREETATAAIIGRIQSFKPDILLVTGWMDRGYLKAARWFRKTGGCTVCLSDSPWRDDWRQLMLCAGRRLLHQRWFDVLWVPGERQADYARRLGFRGAALWQGLYSCDWPYFAGQRRPYEQRANKGFLYVGRLIARKNIEILDRAYRHYRDRVPAPWPLKCIGSGPLARVLSSTEGIDLTGFRQPRDLAAAMADAAAFVMPSRHEPWGVAIHEATALGHPLIVSEACGSTAHLLRHNYNGYLVVTGQTESLARAMIKFHHLPEAERTAMSEASYNLSRQFTPETWAKTLINGYREWLLMKKNKR